MLTERTPWNPHRGLAVFAAVAVILGGIAACSGNDEDKSSPASTATTIERQASSTATSTPVVHHDGPHDAPPSTPIWLAVSSYSDVSPV
jgi:hypothetical protein